MVVEGSLAGLKVQGLKVDTGAVITVVHKDFIPWGAYTGKSVVLDSWKGGQFSRHSMARIAIQIGKVHKVAEVVRFPALLGLDLGCTMWKEMLKLLVEQSSDELPVVIKNDEEGVTPPMVILDEKDEEVLVAQECLDRKEEESQLASEVESKSVIEVVTMQKEVQQAVVPVGVITAQKKRVGLDVSENNRISAESDSDPLPLSEIFEFDDGFFEDDPVPTPVESDDELEPMVESLIELVSASRAPIESEENWDKKNEVASAESDCVPIPMSEVFNFSDAYFEQDPVAIPVEVLDEKADADVVVKLNEVMSAWRRSFW